MLRGYAELADLEGDAGALKESLQAVMEERRTDENRCFRVMRESNF